MRTESDTVVVRIGRDPFDRYIGRPRGAAHWGFGNPHSIGPRLTRIEAVERFECDLLQSEEPRFVWMREHLHELRGCRLGCFCAPLSCHGYVLKKHADMLAPGERLPIGGKSSCVAAPLAR
jgi:Domain of unknown function (DUF4326)